jgi:ribosomal protein S18 acetylase RimI-like enzyme
MLVRRAKPEDGEEIARLFMRAWHISLKHLLPEGFLDKFEHRVQRDKYAERAKDPDWALYVAEADGRVAGLIGAKDNDTPPPGYQKQIKSMYVDPDFQRRGLGQALLKHLFAEMKKDGVKNAMLWCISTNAPACAFYEGQGGRKIEGVPLPEEYAALPHVVYAWDKIP